MISKENHDMLTIEEFLTEAKIPPAAEKHMANALSTKKDADQYEYDGKNVLDRIKNNHFKNKFHESMSSHHGHMKSYEEVMMKHDRGLGKGAVAFKAHKQNIDHHTQKIGFHKKLADHHKSLMTSAKF